MCNILFVKCYVLGLIKKTKLTKKATILCLNLIFDFIFLIRFLVFIFFSQNFDTSLTVIRRAKEP